ncbi:hypothetical protein LCGC14_2858190, partial [marine sediment metagenome]
MTWKDDIFIEEKSLGEDTLLFYAQDIHRERTGVHARLSIAFNKTVLAWDIMNAERDAERVRLANRAHSRLSENVEITKEVLAHEFDTFCLHIWDEQLKRMAAEEMAGDPEYAGISFVLEPFIVQEGGTIIFSPPGRGKSNIAIIMAVCVDHGLNHFWHTTKTKALLVNLERSRRSVRWRLTCINEALGLDPKNTLLTINARGKSIFEIQDRIKKDIKEHDVGLVIVDSMSRAGFGDLNENLSVNRGMDALNSWGVAWMALAHTPRQDETHVFGSVLHDAAADVMVQLMGQHKEDGLLGVGLQITKANDIGPQPMSILALEFSQNGLTRVRKAKNGEFLEIEGQKKMSMEDAIKEYLLSEGKATAT